MGPIVVVIVLLGIIAILHVRVANAEDAAMSRAFQNAALRREVRELRKRLADNRPRW